MNRRDFLKTTAAAAGASFAGAMPDKTLALENRQSRIVRYRPIGNTGLKMSDVSFGAGKLSASSLAERAFDRGINYFDTAPDYGASEEALGGFLQKRKSERDKIIITTKLCEPVPYPGHHEYGTPAAQVIENFNGSLKRLKTDYVDFAFLHALGEREKDEKRLNDPELRVAMETLKKQGKVRFFGFSSHGPHNMEGLVEKAVDSGRFDLMMLSFNFNKFEGLMPVIRKAEKQGMGVIAMKTLAGAKHADLDRFKRDGASFEQAALRWALSHEELSGAVITISNVEQLRNYLAVSGTRMTAADRDILKYYAEVFGREICRIGCGACLASCPKGVNVAEIMRYQMYFENYHNHQDNALRGYNALRVKADSCLDCEARTCEQACPHAVPVRKQLVRAHGSLALA